MNILNSILASINANSSYLSQVSNTKSGQKPPSSKEIKEKIINLLVEKGVNEEKAKEIANALEEKMNASATTKPTPEQMDAFLIAKLKEAGITDSTVIEEILAEMKPEKPQQISSSLNSINTDSFQKS